MKIKIEVEGRTADPGICNCFGRTTTYLLSEIEAGSALDYNDPSGLFGAIKVEEIDEGKVVISYNDKQYILSTEHRRADLASGGRDYTVFRLSIELQ